MRNHHGLKMKARVKPRNKARGKPRKAKPRGALRVVICGSTGDGKSTLIGRLLTETGAVPDDRLAALASPSKRRGQVRDGLDYALLVDEVEAGSEQNSAIDVVHRFGTKRRAFVVADTPGHERYMRNLVTAASNADVAVLLVDARLGVTSQTMRHSRIAALLGIRRIALVINKMDLVHYSEKSFETVVASYRRFAASLGPLDVTPIPAAARSGDNVATLSKKMRWHKGPTVLRFLETAELDDRTSGKPFRFLVESVSQGGAASCEVAGTVVSGSVVPGDSVKAAHSRLASRVSRIVTADGERKRATKGDTVTVVLSGQLDVSRGDLIADPAKAPDVTDQFAAHVVWLAEAPLFPGRGYWLNIGAQRVGATVTTLKHKVDVVSGAEEAAGNLAINEIGFCNLATIEPIALDTYADNPATGAFTLIDRATGVTAGAGMVAFPLRRASNIRHQHYEVNKEARSLIKAQRPCIVWFTGLPSAGKSTVMNLVEQRLHQKGVHTYSLDGDNLRGGLTRDLGFTDADRVENIRRAGEVAKLMVDAGLVVLCAFVSPFRAERCMVRELVGDGEFIEVFVDTPLATCIERDPKGLYRKAREGRVFHVTGIDSPYEKPERPEIHLQPAAGRDARAQADTVLAELLRRAIAR